MTRPRARRRGNARSNGSSSCFPSHDLQTATAQLRESLPAASWICPLAKSERPTADLLRPFFTTLSAQNDPNIHLRTAHFLHALPPSLETLPVLCQLAVRTTSSPHPRDGSALSVTLRAILYLGQNTPRDESTRDAYSRALPTLMHVLQTSIFKPRQTLLNPSSATDETGGKSSSPKYSAHSIRPHALRVLIYLSETVARPMAQYWIQLLPSRPGVSNTNSTRDNLATIVLYDSQTEARSLAVTAITALISSSKTFIQNSFIVSKQTSTAFTPFSARVLNCCRSMFSVLSSCIPKESNGVVVAKLARLTTQLFSAMPTPAMTALSVQALLKSLLQRALDQCETDLTARVACVSALAQALSCSLTLLEPGFLSWISLRIVESLNPNQPVAELLVALRAVVDIRCDLFPCGWLKVKAYLQETRASLDVTLHSTRVFSTFLSSCLRSPHTDRKEGGLHQYISILIDVYHSLVKDSLQGNDRVLRDSAIVAVQLLFQFHVEVVRCAAPCSSAKEFDAIVKDAAQRMKQLIIVRDDQVLAACIRSIAHAHPQIEPDFAKDTLRMICDVMQHSRKSSTRVTKFCMSSMTLIMENLLKQFLGLVTEDVLRIITKGALIATDVLLISHGTDAASHTKSSSDRASDEANKTAAVSLIGCYVCVRLSFEEKKGCSEEVPEDIRSHMQLLCNVLRNSEQTVNLRCCTCRALGRVAAAHPRRLRQYADDILGGILAAMSPLNEVRLQICSTSSLISVVKSFKENEFQVTVLYSCIECHLGVTSQMRKGGITAKLRTQHKILLDNIGELISTVMFRPSEALFDNVRRNWNSQWKPNVMIASVSSYLSLPKYAKYESDSDFDKLMELTPVAQRDVMNTILDLTRSLVKAGEGGVFEVSDSSHG